MLSNYHPLPESTVDPLSCALFLLISFILAGIVQITWFKSKLSQPFKIPIDLGFTCRGRRILGDNKTLRGFMLMLPASSGAFFLLGLLTATMPHVSRQLWPLTPPAFALLGFYAGLGFMAGELPNSFLKRQLDIPPGGAPRQLCAKVLFFLIDRFDSIFGMLLAVSVSVPTPWQTWLYLALLGPGVHWVFSVILYWWGVKGRPA